VKEYVYTWSQYITLMFFNDYKKWKYQLSNTKISNILSLTLMRRFHQLQMPTCFGGFATLVLNLKIKNDTNDDD